MDLILRSDCNPKEIIMKTQKIKVGTKVVKTDNKVQIGDGAPSFGK